MRIGIDARELCGNLTGVGRHLAGLLAAWGDSASAARHSFILYAHRSVTTAVPPGAVLRELPGSGGTCWEQTALPRAAKEDALDVFFAPGYTAPLSLRIPSVLLVHDLSFVTHPEWFRVREGLRRRLLTRWSSTRARTILTVSHASRGEIVAHFGIAPARVSCIYPGIAALDASAAPAEREPLVLFVGSIFNRRHLPDLILAFRQVARSHPDVRLEIVGDNRTYPYQDLGAIVAADGLQDRVAIRSYISDDALADLYRRARAFAFLSEYEGFGHPPLEALTAGVPAVLADTAVAREVCDEAALYVRHDDLAGISSALAKLLFDEPTRTRVLSVAPKVLGRYSWTTAGQATLEAIEAAAAHG